MHARQAASEQQKKKKGGSLVPLGLKQHTERKRLTREWLHHFCICSLAIRHSMSQRKQETSGSLAGGINFWLLVVHFGAPSCSPESCDLRHCWDAGEIHSRTSYTVLVLITEYLYGYSTRLGKIERHVRTVHDFARQHLSPSQL